MNDSYQLKDAQDQKALECAVVDLEGATLAETLTSWLGAPLERGMDLIPEKVKTGISAVANKALVGCAGAACCTLDAKALGRKPRRAAHQGGVGLLGGVCGAIGAPVVLLELPVTTSLMFRSIGEAARCEGFSVALPETRTRMLEVFALGGRQYLEVRRQLGEKVVWAAREWAEAAALHAARAGGQRAGQAAGKVALPKAVEKLIEQLVKRYGPQAIQKAAALSVPAVGAAFGASANMIFMGHYQRRASGHFVVLRLEQRYGAEAVRRAYEAARRRCGG